MPREYLSGIYQRTAIVGKQLQSVQNSSSEIKLNLSQKGIYLLQVKQNQEVKTYKIIY